MNYAELNQDERDRLRYAFEEGFSAGSGKPSLVPDDLVELMTAVADDWFLALETMQAQRLRYADWPGSESIPEWLRAADERQAALGNAQPPDGWIRAAAQNGRP
jgi:hypothetical protein